MPLGCSFLLHILTTSIISTIAIMINYHSIIIRIMINIMVFVVAVIIIVKSSSCPQVHFPPTWPTACNLGVWPERAVPSVSAYKTASGIGKIPLVLRSDSKSVQRGISRQAGPPECLGLIKTIHQYDAYIKSFRAWIWFQICADERFKTHFRLLSQSRVASNSNYF